MCSANKNKTADFITFWRKVSKMHRDSRHTLGPYSALLWSGLPPVCSMIALFVLVWARKRWCWHCRCVDSLWLMKLKIWVPSLVTLYFQSNEDTMILRMALFIIRLKCQLRPAQRYSASWDFTDSLLVFHSGSGVLCQLSQFAHLFVKLTVRSTVWRPTPALSRTLSSGSSYDWNRNIERNPDTTTHSTVFDFDL